MGTVLLLLITAMQVPAAFQVPRLLVPFPVDSKGLSQLSDLQLQLAVLLPQVNEFVLVCLVGQLGGGGHVAE